MVLLAVAALAAEAPVTVARAPEGWRVRWTDRVVDPGTADCAPGRFLRAHLDAARNGHPAPADLAATVTERHPVTVRATDGCR